jgi:uncharacterized lipoprotein YmbA
MTSKYFLAPSLLSMALLVGCGSSPTASFYTLRGGPELQTSTATATYRVVVGPLTIPDLIDRPQLVLSKPGNQVMVSEQVRWAAPLRSELPRVIASNLAQILKDARVSAYPQSSDVNTDYVVAVDIVRFDSVVGDTATLEALWTVRPGKGGDEKNGRSVLQEKTNGSGYGDLVAAHERALSTLSREIAEAIRPINAVSR